MDDLKLMQVVAFCILMEYNGGIVNKSPSYIKEKFRLVKGYYKNEDEIKSELDLMNNIKFETYKERWLSKNQTNNEND